jgi:nucleotide-binding universal stress UspA family protein
MKLSGPVLAATALDHAGDEVLRQAAELAAVAQVPLTVCHVLPEIYGIRPLFPQLRESDRAVADATRKVVAAALGAEVRRVIGDRLPAIDLRIEAGSPHSTVLQVADEIGAGLIVIGAGSHGEGASLGGVGERIVRHASGPVLVARPRSGSTVLAATDFSDPAVPAVSLGRDEARRRDERFAVIHSVEIRLLPVDSPTEAPTMILAELIDAETERAKRVLGELAARYQADEAIVRNGPPADAILDAAARLHADLIVVGTHGRSGLRRMTLGSVAESVLRHAQCSVFIVRLAH